MKRRNFIVFVGKHPGASLAASFWSTSRGDQTSYECVRAARLLPLPSAPHLQPQEHMRSEDDEYLMLELFATWSPPCQCGNFDIVFDPFLSSVH